MPRDQETTSFDEAPSTSRYSFGTRATGPDEAAAVNDTAVADREPAGMDASAGADTTAPEDRGFASGMPGTAAGSVPPAEDEWVAGSRLETGTAATGAHAAPAGATPGSTGAGAGAGLDAAGAAFVTDAEGFRASWVRIQSGFVDDPRGSVTEAADLVSQITSTLVAAVQERERSLRDWDSGNADTENLRNALRDYRALFERLMKV